METIFIVRWRYSDNSSNGIVAAFTSRQRADDLRDLLETHCDSSKVFLVDDTELRD